MTTTSESYCIVWIQIDPVYNNYKVEQNSIMEHRAASMAISCIWAWLIPHFYIEFREFRLALEKASLSEAWNRGCGDNRERSLRYLEKARGATIGGTCWAIGIIGVVYLGSVISIGKLTAQSDQEILTKPDAIVVGVGRMLSSCLLAYFSVELPRWLGLSYSSQKLVETYKHILLEPSVIFNWELSFRVSWSILGNFFTLYPFLLTYFCNESFRTVALSTGVGITFGFFIVYLVWIGHTQLNYRNRRSMAIALSLVIALSSAMAFTAGCWYVKEVWLDNTEYIDEYGARTFFVWLAICLLAHFVYYRLTQRKLAEAKASRPDATVADDPSEAPSMESMKGKWRYKSQVFEPPKSINCVATELTRPFASLPALIKMGRKSQPKQHERSAFEDLDETLRGGNLTISNDIQSLPQSLEQDHNNTADDTIFPTLDKDGITEEEQVVCNSSSPQTPDVSTTAGTIQNVDCCAEVNPSSSPAKSVIKTQDDIHRGTDELVSTGAMDEENNLHVELIEESEIPSLWYMVKVNSCCQRRRHYHAPHRKGFSRLMVFFKWTLWSLAVGWHLLFTVINIGASYQQNKVRNALNGTFEMLYPENYNTGSMCAWNEASQNADIRTFDSLQDVYDANYTAVHCGECGSCSNWDDLSLQWTTRDTLSDKAKECTKQSIMGSSEETQTCNEDTIGFTEECAMCWTDDELCARDNCMFIFLQAFLFTNEVTNYNVGPDDITSATCDEALCGPAFVPCSGATRRRMNIVSDIPRPTSQQCGVATEDWSAIFDVR